MNRNRSIIIGLAVLVLIGLVIYFWPKTAPVPVSVPPVAQSNPPSEPQEKIELTKDGLPAPVAPGLAQQATKPDAEASLLELFMTPIALYGKVVDEKGNPVAGATAKMSVADKPITDGAKYSKITDDKGLFSLTGLHGGAVSVNVTKEGYYTTEQSRGMIRFGKFRSNSDPQIPTAGSPTVFVLRKMGEITPLVKIENFVKVPRNGNPTEISLETGRQVAAGQGDLKVEAWTNDQTKDAQGHYEWKCRISVPGGGLFERKDSYAFEAPADGYQPFDEIVMSHNAERWNPQASRQYFVKLSDNHYACIEFEMVAGGDHFFSITSYLNPTAGARNLEYDPNQPVAAGY
jgi:hypothetical protein